MMLAATPTFHVLIHTAHPGPTLAATQPQAWETLHTPHLAPLLAHAQWSPVYPLSDSAHSSTTETALLHVFNKNHPGEPLDHWPDAAWRLQQTGLHAWVTPCHWHMAQGRTLMLDPHELQLSDADSQTLMQAMHAFFAEDGLTLNWHDALHWQLSGPALRDWPAHALDLMVGRDVQAVLTEHVWPAPLARLHLEMQMLLYSHPLNDARQSQGLPSVNSFWIHGVGACPSVWLNAQPANSGRDNDTATPTNTTAFCVREETTLAHAWRAGQGSGWMQAWRRLDEQLGAELASSLQPQAGSTDPRPTWHLHWCGPQAWRTATLEPLTPGRFQWPGFGASWWGAWQRARQQARLNQHLQALHS